MKKTVKILASLFAFMLLLTGCASNAAKSDSKDQPSDSVSDSTENTPIEVKKLIGGTELELKPELEVGLTGLYNNKLLLCKSVQDMDSDGEPLDTGSDIYYTYDISTGEKTDVGKMAYVSSSVGDHVMMGDQQVYSALTGGNPMGQIFFSLGLEGGKEKIIEYDQNNTTPFCFLSQLNDDEIVLRGIQVLPTEDRIFEYQVRKYNVHTGVFTELIKTEYNRTKDSGKVVASVSCYDNKIYMYMSNSESKKEAKKYIEVYDSNGNYIESYNAEIIDKVMKERPYEDSFWRMYIYKNYFVIETASMNTYIFKLDNNHRLNKIADMELSNFAGCIRKENRELEYMLFGMAERKGFRVFDFETETLRQFEIALDEKCKYLSSGVHDDKGNFVFELSSSDHYDENAVLKYCYLSAEEIKKQLA